MLERFPVAVHILLLYLKMEGLCGLLEEETLVCKKYLLMALVFFLKLFLIYFLGIHA
jgi:hypothetical protein